MRENNQERKFKGSAIWEDIVYFFRDGEPSEHKLKLSIIVKNEEYGYIRLDLGCCTRDLSQHIEIKNTFKGKVSFNF